MAESQNENEQS
jgi:hypothetical protein